MTQKNDEKLGEICKSLSEEQLEKLTEPLELTEQKISVPFTFEEESEAKRTRFTLWLHHHQKRTCYFFHAKYEYQAIVTRDSENGPQFPVDKISLHIERAVDHANYTHSCASTSWCPKTDKITATFNACGRSCLSATATYKGQSWSTKKTCLG